MVLTALLQIINHVFDLHNIRMTEKTISFNNKKINKSNFYRTKKLFKIDDIDVDKILISKKELYGKKTRLNTLLLMKIMITLVHDV